MNRARLQQQLVLHEGLRLTPYTDTLDNLTIGVGYNVSARGWDDLERAIGRKVGDEPSITHEEAMRVLALDIERVEKAVRVHFPEYAKLNDVRQRVVMDMAFNLGFRALGFRNTITAIKQGQWSTAARELFKSKWAGQVGDGEGGRFDRADRLSRMLLTGHDYAV